MHKIYRWAAKFSHLLRFFTIVALAILGLVLTGLLFIEIYSLFPLIMDGNSDHIIFEVLDRIVVFFLFFSFLTMVIAALKHHGRIAVDFLLSLGVMALIRGLIGAHGQPHAVITNAMAILLLIISMVLLKKFKQ